MGKCMVSGQGMRLVLGGVGWGEAVMELSRFAAGQEGWLRSDVGCTAGGSRQVAFGQTKAPVHLCLVEGNAEALLPSGCSTLPGCSTHLPAPLTCSHAATSNPTPPPPSPPAWLQHNTEEPDVPVDPALPESERWAARKAAIMRSYRVCIAIENSNAQDYVTEKAWGALATGCVPVYLGAPNARTEFFPSPKSAIFVEDYPTVEALAAEVQRVLTDEAAWREYTAWRQLPFEQLAPGYRALVTAGERGLPHPRCQLCQILADRKLLRLANATVAAAATAAGTGARS